MTTVVISFEHKQVAADSRVTEGVSHSNKHDCTVDVFTCEEKIRDLYDGRILVWSGDVNTANNFKTEFLLGYPNINIDEVVTTGPTTVAVVGMKAGWLEMQLYNTVQEEKPFWRKNLLGSTSPTYRWQASYAHRDFDYFIFGSGRDYAYAGLIAGMTPEEAIKLAAKCDENTDDNVCVRSFS